MRIPNALLSLLVLPFALAACHGDVSTVRASLLDTDRACASLASDKGFQDAFDHYAMEDAVLLPEYSAALKGKAVVHAALETMPAGTKLSWTPQEAGASRAGDLGYTWGVYELNGTNAAGQPTLSYGKYLSVWKKQDGDWRLAAMMTSQSPGPAG